MQAPFRGFPRVSLLAAGLLAASHVHAQGANPDVGSEELEEILVVAQRADRNSRGATGLDLAIKETPQSISVVTSERMKEWGANDLNDALRLATGLNVEEWETNRTNYMARGFDIVNTQVDGIGMPNEWGLVTGAYDSYGYDKLEVIRGANGLLTGVGNAAGTINYVRKRPTNSRQGELNLSLGSWNNPRVEADYSTPFTDSGSWAGRFVAAWDKSNSYLDLQEDERQFLYAVVDGSVGKRGIITFGYSYQNADTDGTLWGGLPFSLSDGTQAEFPRNATTSQDWTRWDTRNHNAFVEYTRKLGDDWLMKAYYNYRKYEEKSLLFYSWAETGLDPVTREGVLGIPGDYGGVNEAHMGDVSLSGNFSAFGREHEVVLGIAISRSDYIWDTADPDPLDVVMPAFPYAGNTVPEPAWGPRYEYDSGENELRRGYGATRLALTKRLKAIVGFNYTWFRNNGESIYDTGVYETKQSKFSPYAGVTFDITDEALFYASYSDIFQPQQQNDIDFNILAPTQGVNYEVGVKAEWLDRRLLTTLALFSAEQRGLATFAGYLLPDFIYYYEGVDVESEGFELEVTGKVNDYLEVVFGYTKLEMDGVEGEDSYPWTPRRALNLTISGKLPAMPSLELGLGGRWQSTVKNYDDAQVAEIRQSSYAVLHAFADWEISDRLALHLNANNLTDKKYINSVYYVGFYGAPRNYSLGMNWRF